jgi:hypothetical protein
MEFKDRDEVHHFFCFYGFLAGFGVVTTHTIRTTRRKINYEIYKVEMKCHRHEKESDKKHTEQDTEQESMQDVQAPTNKEGYEKENRNTNVQFRTNCPV